MKPMTWPITIQELMHIGCMPTFIDMRETSGMRDIGIAGQAALFLTNLWQMNGQPLSVPSSKNIHKAFIISGALNYYLVERKAKFA